MENIATIPDTMSNIWEEKYNNLVQQLGNAPSDWSQQMRLIVVIFVFSALALMSISIALTFCYMRSRSKVRSIAEPKCEASNETSDGAGRWLESERRRPRTDFSNFGRMPGYLPDSPELVHTRFV
ncbi:hypothetical protein GQ607_013021 [Colletotrichum asianum]|uniref:Uncharacterized protein n=1 Tax=Colletotrichum asianum TaxID=702518 RepID=A0A8H3W4K6_9PEZI|nr:hypothetical protein GQ607_013021 [Colletotrichum asianum]